MNINDGVRSVAFVEFRDVSKIYRMGEVEIQALHEVSFEVDKGELVVIVGPSGAGKTTLLNILGGMDTLSSGRVVLDGREISGTAANSPSTADTMWDLFFSFITSLVI